MTSNANERFEAWIDAPELTATHVYRGEGLTNGRTATRDTAIERFVSMMASRTRRHGPCSAHGCPERHGRWNAVEAELLAYAVWDAAIAAIQIEPDEWTSGRLLGLLADALDRALRDEAPSSTAIDDDAREHDRLHPEANSSSPEPPGPMPELPLPGAGLVT